MVNNKKTLLSRILKGLFFISLLFIVYYFFKQDWLEVPTINSPIILTLSLILVVAGFMTDAGTWLSIVRDQLPSVSYRDTFISSGKYVFAKYIPGKLWVVLGKAGYIKEKYGDSLVMLSSYSIVNQILGIIAALIVSIGVAPLVDRTLFYVLLAITIFLVIILFFFQGVSFRALSAFSEWLLGRQINIPTLSGSVLIRTLLLSLLTWFIWAIAFYLFSISIYSSEIVDSIQIGFIFPVSAVIGIIVLFAPGGLGVREGILTLGLVALGMPAKEAASVALFSRLWFLAGEMLLFIIAMLLTLRR